MTSRSDAELFGFRCDEIYGFLEGHGLKLSLARGEARAAQVLRVPEWARPYVGRRQISLGDTALILAGISPAHTGHLSDDEYAEFSEWRKALIDAIGQDADHAAEISATTWGSNQDAEQMLSHADIRAWCQRRGHAWPITEPSPQPATDAEALAEIDRLRAELVALKAELAEAREGSSFADHPNWPEELGIAMTAWRAALNGASASGKKPGAFIRNWLRTHYQGLPNQAVDRIAIVANWDKTPGPK